MSRVLPILFKTEMVQAILGGRKTVTRRVVKFTEGRNPNWTGYKKGGLILYNGKNEPCNKKPPYQPGDILYVRETWCKLPVTMDGRCCGYDVYYYKADRELRPEGWRGAWKPSIHMPKEAARIWLKVTDVRVERLQDITEEQAEREGCYDYTSTANGFCYIWDSTIKKSDLDRYGWDASPWVWVVEFERCKKPERMKGNISTI